MIEQVSQWLASEPELGSVHLPSCSACGPSPWRAPARWSIRSRTPAPCLEGCFRGHDRAAANIAQPVASFCACAATGSVDFLLCLRALAQEGACSME